MPVVVRVALFSSHGLGDGLIQLVLANNLRINGYAVTYYSDFVYQLNDYISGITVRPFPEYTEVVEELENAHIILYDSNSRFVSNFPEVIDRWFAGNGICYSNARTNPRHQEIRVEQIQRRLPAEANKLAKRVVKLNRSLRRNRVELKRPPIANQLADVLTDNLGLTKRTYESGLRIVDTGLAPDSQRIVIHPTSSSMKKNWTAAQFIQLATRLAEKGWKPVITVSPAERSQWVEMVNDRFEVPVFNTIKQLAEYYHASAAFIGNDSGNAHLASCLDLPNLVIFNRWRKYPTWRPAWSTSYAIYPRTIVSNNWQRKVSVDQVYQVFEQMIENTKTD